MDPQMGMGQPPAMAAPPMAAPAQAAPAPQGPDIGSLMAMAALLKKGGGHKAHPKAKAKGRR